MKKYIYIALSILVMLPVKAKIEILDRVAIIVGEGVVLESQVKTMLENIEKRYQEQGAPMPPKEIIMEQIHERLIIEELQLQLANRAGVRVSDGELNNAFERIAANNNLSLEEFIQTLEVEGESYESLRSQVRKEMVIQRVQQGRVSQEINITEQELEGFLQTDVATRELSPELFLRQVLVSSEELANKILNRISEGEDFSNLAKQYSINSLASKGGEMGWRNLADLPSLFAIELKNKKKGYISRPLKGGSGFYILKIEDKRGDLVRFEEQWSARHILMMPTKLRDKTFTKKELEEVRIRALEGEDFSLLAKEFSEDPGSALQGGDLGWLGLGVLAEEFEATMLEMEIGEISPVFQTEFGFHFLEVLAKRSHELTDDLIKDRAYSILYARKFDEELENTLRTIRSEAFVEFKELD